MIEAMKQALEALDYASERVYCENDDDLIGIARKSLRKAIKETKKQKPVAWMYRLGADIQINLLTPEHYGNNWSKTALYTAPPRKEWVGLTDGEIKNILDCGREGLIDIKKAEQILKEKNT